MSSDSVFSKVETRFLKKQRVARIATIDPNGNYPHVVPICFVFDGCLFYTTLANVSKRARNVKSGAKVSMLVDEYVEQHKKWLVLRGILLKCRVSLLSYHHDRDMFMKGWKMLIRKYPQYKQWANKDLSPRDPERRLIMQIQPTKKTSWGFVS